MWCKAPARFGRITAQSDDVTHARVPIGSCDLLDFCFAGVNAGQVRRRKKVSFPVNPRDSGMRTLARAPACAIGHGNKARLQRSRSEEHTSELQSLMRISSAVLCLNKKKKTSAHQHLHRKSPAIILLKK